MKYSNLKSYTKTLFKIVTTFDNIGDEIELKIINMPFWPIGSVKYDKNLHNASITINVCPYTYKKYNKYKVGFELACALFHEVEHTKTFLKTKQEDFYSFEHLVSLMEFLYYAKTFNISYNKPKINNYKLLKIKKLTDKNYDISTSEINANLVGYSNSLLLFEDKLDEEDLSFCKNIVEILKLLNNNIEIYYNHIGYCMNKFSLFFENTCKYVSKNPDVINKYKILTHLFHGDGTPKNIKEIYGIINKENKNMYQKIILFYMTSVEINYDECFKDEEFKIFVEALINNYINDTITYIKNMEKFKIFVDDKKILNDNLLLKKKNILILNQIANDYNLNINSGTVIDSSSIGNQKKLHKF